MTFSGAQDADENAVGIRYQSDDLTLINDTFTNNQDGTLATPFVENTGTIIEQGITLNRNGTEDGVAHNEYIGLINTLIMENSVSEDTVVGHEVKSAHSTMLSKTNWLRIQRHASYSIDLPDGRDAIIQSNTIEKGPDAETAVMIHYAGGEKYDPGTLMVTDNTFIDDYINPNTIETAVMNQSLNTSVIVSDNTFGKNARYDPVRPRHNHSQRFCNRNGIVAVKQHTADDHSERNEFLWIKHRGTFTKVNYTVVGGSGHLTVTNALMDHDVVGGSGGITFTGGGRDDLQGRG